MFAAGDLRWSVLQSNEGPHHLLNDTLWNVTISISSDFYNSFLLIRTQGCPCSCSKKARAAHMYASIPGVCAYCRMVAAHARPAEWLLPTLTPSARTCTQMPVHTHTYVSQTRGVDLLGIQCLTRYNLIRICRMHRYIYNISPWS